MKMISPEKRRAAHTKYMRAWREKNRKEWSKYNKKWKQEHPENIKIHNANRSEKRKIWKNANRERVKVWKIIEDQLEKGAIQKPILCSRCNQPGKIEAHHPDYKYPLEFIWLCNQCHHNEHMELRPCPSSPSFSSSALWRMI